MKKNLIKEIAFYLLLVSPIVILLLDISFPLPRMKSYSKEIYAKDGTLLTAYLTEDDKWRMYSTIDEVSTELRKAIIEKEDSWFYWHLGINPISIFRAIFTNIFEAERISGASTITMQLARMLEPKSRTYLNKISEMLRSTQLELHYSKNELLDMYLSLLPYGGNIEGVKSASYTYFNCPPNKLSLAQAITLAVIPNNPNKYRIDKNVEAVIAERNKWIRKFSHRKIFPEQDLKDAIEEPLKPNRYSIKFSAPHFCNFINQNFTDRETHTSLDLSIQTKAENLLWNYVQRAYSRNVTNGAVLIIDNRSSSVIAYCGSADFFNKNSLGQVNGIRGIRSPGSTLKPFLFAQAFNSGKYTPKMKLLDIPTDFNGYTPENFNFKFNGEVTAEFALINSLNIPAIRLLQDIGLNEFLSQLEKGNFKSISEKKDKLGLSIILGGCGVTLEELTKFYTVFPNGGKLYPLKYLIAENKNEVKGISIFSESAAYMISEILSQNKRPDLHNEYLSSTKLPKIAWKTGTSYGKRDAWAIGFNPKYTIGVWMGNFDGKGSPYLSGAEMAVPLLFDLFNTIDYDSDKEWFNKPNDLLERKVAAETGLLPSKFCSSFTLDYFIKNVSHNNLCNLYKEAYINEEHSVEYCPNCLPENYVKAAYPNYPPELEMWFNENGVQYKKHPPHNPNCEIRYTDRGPIILSPSKNYEYLIERKSNEEILLQAAPDASIRIHYWYINNKFYKKSSPGTGIFFKPSEGITKITCLDDKGRDESISIRVKYY